MFLLCNKSISYFDLYYVIFRCRHSSDDWWTLIFNSVTSERDNYIQMLHYNRLMYIHHHLNAPGRGRWIFQSVKILSVAVAWSVESLPSNPANRVRFPTGSGILICPRLGCVFFVCVLSSVVFGGGPDIVLTTHSGRPALVYLSSVLVQRLLLLLQASDPRAFGL